MENVDGIKWVLSSTRHIYGGVFSRRQSTSSGSLKPRAVSASGKPNSVQSLRFLLF